MMEKTFTIFTKMFCQIPFADVLQNRCSYKFHNIHSKTPVLESLLKKVVGLKACNFIKERLQHRRFSMSITKFLRAAFLTQGPIQTDFNIYI